MLESKLQFPKQAKENEKKNISYIDIDSIRPNPYQPRRQFSRESSRNCANRYSSTV